MTLAMKQQKLQQAIYMLINLRSSYTNTFYITRSLKPCGKLEKLNIFLYPFLAGTHKWNRKNQHKKMARRCIKLCWLIGALMMSQVACGSTNGNGNGINGASTTMGASTSPAVISLGSTSTSILSTYLASLPANEQLSPLTTILLQQQQLQQSTTSMSGEKLTTSGPNIPVVDFSQTPMQMQTQAPLVTFADTSSTFGTSILTETVNIEPQPEHPTIITNEHELLGCGPNNREGIGIQKALDWLREKRSPDYSWENDTNMVILAKELSNGKESNSPDEQTISDLENLLSIKQMEIEIMTILDQHRSIPKPQPNSDRLARYILSLGSLCKDSRRFYGHDLVAGMFYSAFLWDIF